jgi:hypothetical protein
VSGALYSVLSRSGLSLLANVKLVIKLDVGNTLAYFLPLSVKNKKVL